MADDTANNQTQTHSQDDEHNRQMAEIGKAAREGKPVTIPSKDEPGEKLLAGKYKTPEELERGYLELQRAFSEKTAPKGSEETKEEPGQKTEADNSTTTDADPFVPFFKEFAEKGSLSEESYQNLLEKHGLTKSVVDTFIKDKVELNKATERLQAVETARLEAIAGGEKAFNAIAAWAQTALTAEERAAFDKAVEDVLNPAAEAAVKSLVERYRRANGFDGRNIQPSGNSPANPSTAPFTTTKEMTDAMADPRYAKDLEYQKHVHARVAASRRAGYLK